MSSHEVILKPSAIRDLDGLRRFDAAAVAEGVEELLTHEPTKESKSRIKRLRGKQVADYRLRLGDFRVFYTVDEYDRRVDVLRVLHKKQTAEFYEEEGS
jgi:mRNA-degrading endonuclease RelE of RelBE toxin-antitoxin system